MKIELYGRAELILSAETLQDAVTLICAYKEAASNGANRFFLDAQSGGTVRLFLSTCCEHVPVPRQEHAGKA